MRLFEARSSFEPVSKFMKRFPMNSSVKCIPLLQKITILPLSLPVNFGIKQSASSVFNHGEEFATNHLKNAPRPPWEPWSFVRLDHQGSYR